MLSCIHADTNAAVYFNQSSYSVNESSAGLLQVCVGLTGRPEVDVVVMVTSDDITARGKIIQLPDRMYVRRICMSAY